MYKNIDLDANLNTIGTGNLWTQLTKAKCAPMQRSVQFILSSKEMECLIFCTRTQENNIKCFLVFDPYYTFYCCFVKTASDQEVFWTFIMKWCIIFLHYWKKRNQMSWTKLRKSGINTFKTLNYVIILNKYKLDLYLILLNTTTTFPILKNLQDTCMLLI